MHVVLVCVLAAGVCSLPCHLAEKSVRLRWPTMGARSSVGLSPVSTMTDTFVPASHSNVRASQHAIAVIVIWGLVDDRNARNGAVHNPASVAPPRRDAERFS